MRKSSIICLMTVAISILVLCTSSVFAANNPKLVLKPYGFIKLDSAFDTAHTNNGNFTMWVNDKGASDEDSEFNMTARQTRLGVMYGFENLDGADVTGRFEFDFYGGGTENKNFLMLRHAYMKIDFGEFYLLAGQTSDIISPLVPTTVNYPVLWNSGNIGYRRPQIQLGTKTDSGIELVGALTRNIAGDVDLDGNDDGEDSGLPMVQGRVSYITDAINVGLSGHYGSMEFVNTSGDDDSYSTYSINVHASCAITDAISLKGEVFTGEALSQFLGGIGQGFDSKGQEGLVTTGGWVNAQYKLDGKTSFNAGLGLDSPDEDAALTRRSTQAVYLNAFRSIAHNTTVAFELSQWTTGYYDAAGDETDTSNLRAQLAFIFNIK